MTADGDKCCPCCGGHNLLLTGKLPDCSFFAGKSLEQPLPGGTLYRCRHCHLKFRYPMHDTATYDRLYDNATVSTWPSAANRVDWNLVSNLVLEHLPKGGRVLDFGCYTGGLLARLPYTCERYGVEVNRAAAAVASNEVGTRIWSTIDEIPSDLRFDVVIATDVVEHMMNPSEIVDKLAALLANDGILIITTGDADNYLWNRFGANWWYCFFPEHVTFLSKAWFDHLAQENGLSILRYQVFRYCRKAAVRRVIDAMFMYFYGWFPTVYLRLANTVSKAIGRPPIASVPGIGVTADHFIIALSRKVAP